MKLAGLADRECAACGGQAANSHHVLPKDRGGDDVRENIIGLCGSGTSGCHGAHHGSPYVVNVMQPVHRGGEDTGEIRGPVTERRDAEWVNRRIGQTLAERRQDTIEYVLGRLGTIPGGYFLMTTYHIEFTPNGWRTIE